MRERELVHAKSCSPCEPRKSGMLSIINLTHICTPGKLPSHLMDTSRSRVGNFLKHVLERAEMRHCGVGQRSTAAVLSG